MKNRNKILFMTVILSFLLPLSLSPEPVRVFESFYAGTEAHRASMPDRNGLKLMVFFVTEAKMGFRFSVAVYDDPRTKREVDYMELYDDERDLLLVSWIDRYGIVRLAVESGLLEKESPEVERVLVFLTRGTAL